MLKESFLKIDIINFIKNEVLFYLPQSWVNR